jgi:hypothetical protein
METQQHFSPVIVKTRQFWRPRRIESVQAAAIFLVDWQWPKGTGLVNLRARAMCRDAMEGKASVEEARNCFIEAAKAAGIFLGEEC